MMNPSRNHVLGQKPRDELYLSMKEEKLQTSFRKAWRPTLGVASPYTLQDLDFSYQHFGLLED
jgi:hypothetical protein